jgi:hypothetical protein
MAPRENNLRFVSFSSILPEDDVSLEITQLTFNQFKKKQTVYKKIKEIKLRYRLRSTLSLRAHFFNNILHYV